jgi:hypothetical protein
MRQIQEFEILDHGVEHSQYFQGCGVSFTPYTDVYTGIGSSAHEALEDALEQAACSDWETEGVENTLSKESSFGDRRESPQEEDSWHYVSLRVR